MPWDKAASPYWDRLLSITNADSDDPDAAGAGLSDEEDYSEDATGELEEHELDAADQGGEEDPYKKRFADTKSDRDRLKKELDARDAEAASLRAELEALRGQQQTHRVETGRSEIDEMNETQVAMEIAEAVNREYLALPNEKRNVATLTQLMTAKVMKRMREDAAKISEQAATRVVATVEGKRTARDHATSALVAAGLDAEKHFPILRTVIQQQMDKDPGWFQRTGHDLPKQYAELATRTKDYLASLGVVLNKDEIRKANEEHLREAGGQLGGGTRRVPTTPREAPETKDGGEQGGTMIAAMAANRRSLHSRAQRVSGLARR